MGKEMQNGTLVLNVIHGKEVEVEYKKSEIIEKINSFFGYNCIENIKLKIIQNNFEKRAKIFPKIKDLSRIEEKMKKVDNAKLKNSLNGFLKAYHEKNK